MFNKFRMVEFKDPALGSIYFHFTNFFSHGNQELK